MSAPHLLGIPNGRFAENCWVVADPVTARAAVIDPGEEASTTGILQFVDPVFTTTPRDRCAEVGSTAVFQGVAESSASFFYLWYEGATMLSNNAKFSGTSTDTLTVHNIALSDNGRQFRLRAIVGDPFCSTYSDPATLTAMAVGTCPPCQFDPGDLDGDGDFDLADMQQFSVCFGADITVDTECACANVNEGNNVVDLADWTAMELLIDGPN